MTNRISALKLLLAGDLPLERVGPHLRHACRRAIRSGEPDRMLLHARVVAAELLRRGELLAVAVEKGANIHTGGDALHLVRGSNRVIDLAVLGAPWLSEPAAKEGNTEPKNHPSTPPTAAKDGRGFQDLSGLFLAMERAQDLEIGDPRSADKGVILASILPLVSRLTPHLHLFIMLPVTEPLPPGLVSLFSPDTREAGSGWMALRAPGHSVWIPTPDDLPRHLREISNRPVASGEAARFQTAAAVSLWEPPDANDPDRVPEEAGLLFLVAEQEIGRDPMLRLAERISRFVTRRWQHLRAVNLRIHVDTLTGVFNRGYFDTQLALELERARRSDVPLTLVIADLDKFKDINDTYGHPVGDAALKMVARRLQDELRRIDHICRIGGEEFGLILPATGQDAAQEVMSRILDAEFKLKVANGGTPRDLNITFSYGAVTFPSAPGNQTELYSKADAMLYLSKDLGRNRCHFWSNDNQHLMLLPGASAP